MLAPLSRRAARRWLLLAILLLAFGLRLYRLAAQSLWYDETVSVYLAGQSLPDLIAHTAGDIHPPGYYLLLHGWTRLAGHSDWAAAFFSVFFGLLLVALAYRLAARLFGPRAGLLAAVLVAVSPYNLWYSQEVRMYTLGAALGMGLLAAAFRLLPPGADGPPWRRLLLYALFGALGLWVLYYFAFLLVALALLVGLWWLAEWRRGRARGSWLGRWALAQVAVLLLYAPWLPIAWRQATDPPVPPWRSATGLGSLLVQTWSALSLGQSVDPAAVWPALLLFALLVGLGLLYPARRPASRAHLPSLLIGGYVLVPVLLIYLASAFAPLYHVRYVFTYSTPFYVLLAAGLAWLWQRWRPALGLALAALVALSGLSIYAYHTGARYAADDHRGAVHFLADRWRPGDAILVDAGYAYTALLTYWDGDPIAWRGRLVDYGGLFAAAKPKAGQSPAAGLRAGPSPAAGPVVVQAGTVDGDRSLGWGDPASDFYAMDRPETAAALERLFAAADRVWVYRIYDTVTDPDGFIRGWLAGHGTPFEDRVFTGESQLRVQGFLTGRDPLATAGRRLDVTLADGSLALLAADLPSADRPPADLPQADRPPATVPAGGALDLALVWRVRSPLAEGAILFAGLFDDAGRRWAQADERPLGSLYPAVDWPPGATIRTPLRLEVPPGTAPGALHLEVGWYRFEDGQPVWLPWPDGVWQSLGTVQVVAPPDWAALPLPDPGHPAGVTMGDGVRFLGFEMPRLEGRGGDDLAIDLYWQAVRDAPGAGLAVLQLADDAGTVVAESAAAPAGGRAPFAGLRAGQPLRDPRLFHLPAGLAPGVYTLSLGRRPPGGDFLPVRRGPLPLGHTYPLATIRLLPNQ